MRISDWSSDVCSSDLSFDPEGNLVYRKTARNFNPNMATAGKITIAEVEEIVPAGALDPDQVHTPGIYVDRIIQGRSEERRVGKECVSTCRSGWSPDNKKKKTIKRRNTP